MKCHRNCAHFNFFLQENQLLSLILQAIHGGTASLCSKYLILLFPPFPVRQPAPDQDNSGKQQQCRALRHHRGQLNIHAGLNIVLFVLLFVDKAGHFFGNNIAFVDGERQRVLGFHIALECFGFTDDILTIIEIFKQHRTVLSALHLAQHISSTNFTPESGLPSPSIFMNI